MVPLQKTVRNLSKSLRHKGLKVSDSEFLHRESLIDHPLFICDRKSDCGLNNKTLVRQSFLFYQQCLCVTQKQQLHIPAVFVLQLPQLSFAVLWRNAMRRLRSVSLVSKTTHSSAEGDGIFLFPPLTFGTDTWKCKGLFLSVIQHELHRKIAGA